MSEMKWHSLPGADDIEQTHLQNGIRLLTRSNFNSPSVVMMGYLPTGSLADPAGKLGLANFTSRSLMLGNQHHSMNEIYDQLESAGASLSISAGTFDCWFYGQSLVEDLSLLMMHLSQSFIKPVFPQDQIEKLRAKLLTSIAIREDDTYQMASLTFDELLFGNHPYGKPSTGYRPTIEAITKEDIMAHHAGHYGPAGLVLVVVGAIDHEQARREVERAFGAWLPVPVEPVIRPALPADLTQPVRKHVVLDEKSQTDLVMGGTSPARTSADYEVAYLANNILGVFGMMGRIGERVREKSGMAYYASSRLTAWHDCGTWEVLAGVNPDNLEKAISQIGEELRRFIGEGVTANELRDSQANLIGQLPLAMESNAGVANAITNIARYGLDFDHYRSYPQRMQAITAEHVQRVAARYLRLEGLVTSSAGR